MCVIGLRMQIKTWLGIFLGVHVLYFCLRSRWDLFAFVEILKFFVMFQLLFDKNIYLMLIVRIVVALIFSLGLHVEKNGKEEGAQFHQYQ